MKTIHQVALIIAAMACAPTALADWRMAPGRQALETPFNLNLDHNMLTDTWLVSEPLNGENLGVGGWNDWKARYYAKTVLLDYVPINVFWTRAGAAPGLRTTLNLRGDSLVKNSESAWSASFGARSDPFTVRTAEGEFDVRNDCGYFSCSVGYTVGPEDAKYHDFKANTNVGGLFGAPANDAAAVLAVSAPGSVTVLTNRAAVESVEVDVGGNPLETYAEFVSTVAPASGDEFRYTYEVFNHTAQEAEFSWLDVGLAGTLAPNSRVSTFRIAAGSPWQVLSNGTIDLFLPDPNDPFAPESLPHGGPIAMFAPVPLLGAIWLFVPALGLLGFAGRSGIRPLHPG